MLAGISVCARSGFELDFQWAEGKFTDVTGKALESKDLSDGVVEFPISKGKSDVLQARQPASPASLSQVHR